PARPAPPPTRTTCYPTPTGPYGRPGSAAGRFSERDSQHVPDGPTPTTGTARTTGTDTTLTVGQTLRPRLKSPRRRRITNERCRADSCRLAPPRPSPRETTPCRK